MKKLLEIIAVSLLLSVSTYAEEKKYKNTDQFIKDTVEKLSLVEVTNKANHYRLKEITSNINGVQYHFRANWDDVEGTIPIICFVDEKKTFCKVP